MKKVIIVGSTPAAYNAALYTATANNHPTLIISRQNEKGNSKKVKNYDRIAGLPGMTEKKFRSLMVEQLKRFGVEIVEEDVVEIKKKVISASTPPEDCIESHDEVLPKGNIGTRSIHVVNDRECFALICDYEIEKEENVFLCGGEEAIVSLGSGCMAAMDCNNYIETNYQKLK